MKKKKRSYGMVLHIGNAHPPLVQSKFDPRGIDRLRNPPDGPNIAPCDSRLFRYLKMKFEGIVFDTLAALFAEVEEILRDIRITEWVNMFDE
jgi:hypothetical protein